MNKPNLITLNLLQLLAILHIIIMFLFSTNSQAANPLVKVTQVEAWNKGLFNILNCEIDVPFMRILSSETQAKLKYILPKGSDVQKGALIAEQDDYFLMQSLHRLQQNLKISLIAVEYNLDEYNRLFSLKNNMVSPSVLNEFSFKHKQAKSKYIVLKNEISELEYRIKSMKYFAPSDGAIAHTFIRPGEYLNQGDKLISFVSDNDKEINCEVPIALFDVKTTQKQNQFSIEQLPLKVKRISKILNKNSQFVNVYLQASADVLPYLLGQRVKVEMTSHNDNLAKLPLDGINLSPDGHYTWRVSGDGEIEKVQIKIVSNLTNAFLVESKLKQGDKVITLGKSGLVNKQKVSFAASGKTQGDKL
ncbi:efflux RND transporter periplasmic adaptor subunit [Pseudoalteromonas denitrificans]|uniref:RND family efflux transporter, MFP subunit n=1 Tax=Pseudoalteromonas denitrificans DSM 6059 TaxID=1123010 RepID=A0A1I1NB83_9GAMM|nr:efflux RND transporter periplasmic adaptor subunit [Pseudoalteromonas denitrificans]SFC94502.1 RND family efflux transporter, MFP subunit [Pseudoalteromonas denitrificans DSM 6059]